MYNRYQGNSGRVERVPDAPQPSIRPRPPAPPAGNNKPRPGGAGGGVAGVWAEFLRAHPENEGLEAALGV